MSCERAALCESPRALETDRLEHRVCRHRHDRKKMDRRLHHLDGSFLLVVQDSIVQCKVPIIEVVWIVHADVVFWVVSMTRGAVAEFLPAVQAMQDIQSMCETRPAWCLLGRLVAETSKEPNGLSLQGFIGDGFNDAFRVTRWSEVLVWYGTRCVPQWFISRHHLFCFPWMSGH